MAKLTTRLLREMKPNDLLRDSAQPGFFAQTGKTGAVSLKWQGDYRPGRRSGVARKRQTIRVTIGRWPETPLDDARAEATRLAAEVRAGRDPRAPQRSEAEWTVGRGFEAYVRDLAKRPGTEASQRDMTGRLGRYLEDWRDVPLASLTRAIVEERQMAIQAAIRKRAADPTSRVSPRATGARAANAVVRDLSAVWNFAADYTELPGANPCRRIKMIGEVRAHKEVPFRELPAWWAAVGELKNPLRRAMHRLGLLSGLRPGNLTSIQRGWCETDRIVFPAGEMKNRRPFVLPLSGPMAELVEDAKAAGDVLYPGALYLFPSRGRDGCLQPIKVVREKSAALKERTGHALRHTWKNAARQARLPESSIEILLAHSLGGQRDTYGSLAEQFDRLLEEQCQVTAHILQAAGVTEATHEGGQ